MLLQKEENKPPAPITAIQQQQNNITKLEDNIGTIKKLQGVKFEWDKENEYLKNAKNVLFREAFTGDSFGFIAQEVEKVVPGVVDTNDEGYKAIEYGQLVSLGIGSVQEHQKKIDNIFERINKLKELISG